MAVQPADLLTPTGRLERKVLWPGVSLTKVTEYLTAYLADADQQPAFDEITDVVVADRARKAWAYYRAFDEVYQRLLAQPSTVADSDEGSQSYVFTQITSMGERAAEQKALFDSIIEEETGEGADEDFTTLRSLRD